LRLYREEGIDIAFVRQTAEHHTGVGFILVEAETGNNCIALDPGANEFLSAAEVAQCDSAFKSAAVVLTQLEIPVAAAEAALARGRANGAITILNPAPVRPLPASVLELVDVLTPNQTEAKVLTGRSPDAGVEPEELGRDLGRKGSAGGDRVIVETHPGNADVRGRYYGRRRCLQRRACNRAGIGREPRVSGRVCRGH